MVETAEREDKFHRRSSIITVIIMQRGLRPIAAVQADQGMSTVQVSPNTVIHELK